MIRAIPIIWKQKINYSEKDDGKSCVVPDHNLLINTRVVVLDKLTAREMYSVLLLSSGNIPTFQKYSTKFFQMKVSIRGKFIYYQELSL